jgi:hypothetical protein
MAMDHSGQMGAETDPDVSKIGTAKILFPVIFRCV